MCGKDDYLHLYKIHDPFHWGFGVIETLLTPRELTNYNLTILLHMEVVEIPIKIKT
jgi:hypothetical protein